jgi:septal ring factor EnvC (AmiA/AmiB activator)
VNPNLVVHDENGEIYTVRYDAVSAMLLNEVLKEHKKVEQQDRKLKEQGVMIAQLKKDLRATTVRQQRQIEALTAGLQKVSAQLEESKPASRAVVNNQ